MQDLRDRAPANLGYLARPACVSGAGRLGRPGRDHVVSCRILDQARELHLKEHRQSRRQISGFTLFLRSGLTLFHSFRWAAETGVCDERDRASDARGRDGPEWRERDSVRRDHGQ